MTWLMCFLFGHEWYRYGAKTSRMCARCEGVQRQYPWLKGRWSWYS